MIYNEKLTTIGDRSQVLQYLADKKSRNPNMTLIDVGATANPWSKDYLTHIVDIKSGDLNVKYFTGNVSDVDVWNEVLDYVSMHGKFDFLVATHLLEDISAAVMVCNMFSRIAKEGFIAVPSKYSELSFAESNIWRGYIHHRWIYDMKNGNFVGYPKQTFLEHMSYVKEWADTNRKIGREELQFFWKNDIRLHAVNGDLLGPTIDAVIDYYKELTV